VWFTVPLPSPKLQNTPARHRLGESLTQSLLSNRVP
jgi:hypothetical protein